MDGPIIEIDPDTLEMEDMQKLGNKLEKSMSLKLEKGLSVLNE
jgi:hypothetical protein